MENAQPEPSMEEILASIRRIISEDEEDPTDQASGVTKPTLVQKTEKTADSAESPFAAKKTPPAGAEEDGAEPHLETEDVEMIKKNVAAVMDNNVDEAILDKSSADAASQAFANLSQSVRVSDGDGRTLESIVIDMLKPMVKDWLDANLPAIVEDKVEEEVQRVARRRG